MNAYSFITNSDAAAIAQLYAQYQQAPQELDPSWQAFFKGFEFGEGHSIEGAGAAPDSDMLKKEVNVTYLIHAYRSRGHLLSNTNPIRPRKDRNPGVDLEFHNLTPADLDKKFAAGYLVGLPNATLAQIIERCKSIYCRSIGIEYMHIRQTEIREWCKQKFEAEAFQFDYDLEKKKRILQKLNEAVVFENFLHRKYVGQKRFSLEGGENTIPALDAIINKSAQLGVKRFAIGMAHRGRLNVLANTLGKTYEYIFNEFEGNYNTGQSFGDGDVKYHLGFSSILKTPSNDEVYVSLVPNPSHLEAVAPVVLGYLRSKCEVIYNSDYSKVLPIIIHGDAALSGQGLVYEVAQMSGLPGYTVGGALHFVINNQIGFTTDFYDARTSDYCTAVAEVTDSPVLHVNGDDAEAVVWAVEFAAEFRHKFGRDVYVDMLCYRKHGHNESDEPQFTQPYLYNLIAKHPDARRVYSDKLIQAGDIHAELAKQMEENFKNTLQERLDMVKQKTVAVMAENLSAQWEGIGRATAESFNKKWLTGVSKENLDQIIKAITSYPSNINPIKKTLKVLDDRQKLYNLGKADWALAEMLAYGSILLDGSKVRMSGQDVIRGTFSHRHAKVVDAESVTGEGYINLNHMSNNQGKLDIYNSFLSEYAVLGFEYGYSTGTPAALTIWEAQFGDFSNGAQVVIDQFIAAGESKWNRMSGMVMLLPHGYEGQGPEHSSARLERYLQLSAEYNMIVANISTPANFFHLIRRQQAFTFRKPLIVVSPKSLLRHPGCQSNIDELITGSFMEMIDDASIKQPQKVKRVLLCSGKIYYDLLKEQEAKKRKDVAIVRIEQLYPMPEVQLDAVYKKYENAEFCWVQEEPKNMGAWTYMFRYDENRKLNLISRKSSASPATGFAKVHEKEQADIVDRAFTL